MRVGFGGAVAWAIKTSNRKSVKIDTAGEFEVQSFSLRMLADAFSPMPGDNDLITIDSTSFLVADVMYESMGATCKLTCMEVDTQ